MATADNAPAGDDAQGASAASLKEAGKDIGAEVPGPGKIKASVVHEDPIVIHYEDFVSAAESEHILQLCEGRWQRSTVSVGKASELLSAGYKDQGQEAVGETRTSDSVHLTFDESIVVERIAARVASVCKCNLEDVEALVALRYQPGQFFKRHHDGAMRPSTVFVYLNTMEPGSGGETYFPHLGFQVHASAGSAVMWKNRLPDGSADPRMHHEAKPVLKGVKYGMNCFVNMKPQRDAGHIVLVQHTEDDEGVEGVGEAKDDEDVGTEETESPALTAAAA